MKNFWKSDDGMYLILIGIMLVWGLLFLHAMCNAQNVQQQGNTFVAQKSLKANKQGKETPTPYTYQDTKGKTYQIYLSASGKAFIKKVSQKTGKEYKQYLPEVGKRINPTAYKEDKK